MQPMTRRILAGTVTVAVAALVPGAFAQPQPRPPERAVALVAVDFAAVAADGHPVPDLKAEDVTIRIGGRRRAVRSLQLILVADATHVPAARRADLQRPFATNADSNIGRSVVLVIDDDSFRAGREAPLREAVDQVIAQLSPRDRLSLVTMPYGGIKVPLTDEHARVRTALSRIVGQAGSTESGSELACRTGRTLESLTGYLDTQGIRETPLTIMFVSGGLAAPRRDAPIMMAPGRCELRQELYAQVGAAAGAARAQFYVIQPGDRLVTPGERRAENIAGVGFLGSDNPTEGLEHLAGVTGGTMLNLTNSSDGAMARVLREASAYYLASVDTERNDRSGRSQQLDVRVRRAGVQIRSRPHVTFAPPDIARPASSNPSPRDMLSVSDVFRALPLQATAYTAFDGDGTMLRVVALVQPVEPGVTLSALATALFDMDGKLVSHWAAATAELQRRPLMGAVPAAPGAYRLRVAAIDTQGRSGTVDDHITTDVAQTGTLKLSSLVLGLSRGGAFVPRLQFSNEPVAIGYVEMHGAVAGARVNATLEVSTTTNGPALVAVPLAIEGAGINRYTARGAVPIGALPPGDYVVRAIVGLDGYPMTRVVRTLRKTGR